MAGQRNKTSARIVQENAEHATANGVWTEGLEMPSKRRGKPVAQPPQFDWRLLMSGNQLGLIAFIVSAITALYSAGWIPGIAKQTDVSGLSQQVVEVKSSIERVSKELAEMRGESLKAFSSIARIEGRLETPPRPRQARPAPTPPAPKPKGLFD